VPVVDDDLPGAEAFYAEDSWGNRLEFGEISKGTRSRLEYFVTTAKFGPN